MRLLPLLLSAFASCAAARVHEVADSFQAEYARVRVRVPTREDLEPARAANAPAVMARTAALGRAYLETRPSGLNRDYGRALLACAHLMRGETKRAHELMRDVRPIEGQRLTPEHAFVRATHYAAAACRSVDARVALEETLARKRMPRAFLEEFGYYVGIDLPDPAAPAYETLLGARAEALARYCVAELPADPRGLERVASARAGYRRFATEQIHDDTAALVAALPPPTTGPNEAAGEWLTALGAALLIVQARIYEDLLPERLRRDQRDWFLEQAHSLYDRARRAARFVSAEEKTLIDAHTAPVSGAPRRDAFRQLYRHLLSAQVEVTGWIETR